MKATAKPAESLRNWVRQCVRDVPADPPTRMDPLAALVRAFFTYDATDEQTDAAMRALQQEFVDYNELRVATELELQEIIGPKYPDVLSRSRGLRDALHALFGREHAVTLEPLAAMTSEDAARSLHELPGVTPFVEAYVTLFALGGHAIPIDAAMAEWLKETGTMKSIAKGLDNPADLQRALCGKLKPEECFAVFHVLRDRSRDRLAHPADPRAAKGEMRAAKGDVRPAKGEKPGKSSHRRG